MMKKMMAALLALVLVFSLCACGESQPAQTQPSAQTTPSEEVTPSEETPTEEVTPSEETPTEEVTPTEQEEKGLTAGTTTDNCYVSDFAGVTCTLGSDWVFMTDEEIQANNELAMNLIGEDYAEALAMATVATDMFATNANGTDTVNVAFEKLTGINALITEANYAEISASPAVTAFETMGFTDLQYTIGTMQFAGSEHTSLQITGTYAGIAMYETMAVVKVGNYMMLVTACTWTADTTADILANFTAI